MERTCLNCGHQFEDDPALDVSETCPACESTDTIGADIEDVYGEVNEEDLEGVDDGVWQ